MNRLDQNILSRLFSRIKEEFPEAQIWAFGSRARGDATNESDLDVCVLVNNLTPDTRREISDIAWEVGFEADVLISTVAFSFRDFHEGPQSVSPLVQTILREGIAA